MNFFLKFIAKIFNSILILNNPYIKFGFLKDNWQQIQNAKRQLLTIDATSVLYPEAVIYNPPNDTSKIIVGKNSYIQGELHIFKYGGKIEIGNNTYIGKDSRIWSGDHIRIGNDVLISHFCNIIDTNSHEINAYERADRSKQIFETGHWDDKGSIQTSPITIGDYVWISFNVTILKGVSIGEGAIIGAGSFITKDVPAWSLVVGNPAIVLKEIPVDQRNKNYRKQ